MSPVLVGMADRVGFPSLVVVVVVLLGAEEVGVVVDGGATGVVERSIMAEAETSAVVVMTGTGRVVAAATMTPSSWTCPRASPWGRTV